MRRRRWMVLVAVAALAVSGCTSDGEGPEPTQATDGSSAAPEVDAPLCDVIDADVRERLSGDRTPREDLMLGHEGFVGCDLDGMSTFEFGVQVVDDGRALQDHAAGESEAYPDLGDEAFVARTEAGGQVVEEVVVAREGERVVYVRNGLLQYGDDRATTDDTRAVAEALLALPQDTVDQVPPEIVASPCPGIDQVEPVLGDVVLARAQLVPGDDDLSCAYLSSQGVRLLAERYVGEGAADLLGSGDALDVEGAERAEVYSDDVSVETGALVASDVLWRVGTVVVGDREATVSTDPVVALLRGLVAAE